MFYFLIGNSFFFLSPHEMKEEIETKHFEHILRFLGTKPRCRATPHQVEVCAFHHNLSPMGFIV